MYFKTNFAVDLSLDVGISLKTQELYAIVFATRYLDIFTDFISLYNTVMKLIFLGSSFSIVWYMRSHKIVRRSYDKDQDTFRHLFLILPCLLLALIVHEKFTFKEVFPYILLVALLILYLLHVNTCYKYHLSYFYFFCLAWRVLCRKDGCTFFFYLDFSYALQLGPGHVGIFYIFGSCCHTSSACVVTKNKEYWQLNWAICVSSWVCFSRLNHTKKNQYWLFNSSLHD